MRKLFLKWLAWGSTIVGSWFFVLLSRGVAVGYFLLFPSRVRVGIGFYRALFPDRGLIYHGWCTFRQFQHFTSVFLDRFLFQTGYKIRWTFEGRDHLYQALAQHTGGIILMSHMGNWEMAAHLLHKSIPDLPLMLLMGQRAGDEIESLQKEDLKATGIHIVAVDQEGGSPFELLQAMSFIKSGGFVSMTGDMVWQASQRAVQVRFLKRVARLPEAPHMLALVSGAPLFIFFASSKGGGCYHFKILGPLFVTAHDRSHRREAITRSAQTYADMMQDQLRDAPFEWYHFGPFFVCGSDTPSAAKGG